MRTNKGWELLIVRLHKQWRQGKARTVGIYQVYHDGAPTPLFGMTAESPIPGDNKVAGNRKAVEPGIYPLLTQDGEHYKTYGYVYGGPSDNPKPGIELGNTGNRKEIIIHPGRGFLSSVGCINLSHYLPSGAADMDWEESRKRVIDMIEDMKDYIPEFPEKNGYPIPNASVVIVEV